MCVPFGESSCPATGAPSVPQALVYIDGLGQVLPVRGPQFPPLQKGVRRGGLWGPAWRGLKSVKGVGAPGGSDSGRMRPGQVTPGFHLCGRARRPGGPAFAGNSWGRGGRGAGGGGGAGRGRPPPIRRADRGPRPPACAPFRDRDTMAPARLLALLLLLLVGAPAAGAESVGAWRFAGGAQNSTFFVPGTLGYGGDQGSAPPAPKETLRSGKLWRKLGSWAAGGSGWPPRSPCAPACCSSLLPLASALTRAPGSDVTKPVSPSPHLPHLPWGSWYRLGAPNPSPRQLGARSRQLQNRRCLGVTGGGASAGEGEEFRVLRGLVSHTAGRGGGRRTEP